MAMKALRAGCPGRQTSNVVGREKPVRSELVMRNLTCLKFVRCFDRGL